MGFSRQICNFAASDAVMQDTHHIHHVEEP